MPNSLPNISVLMPVFNAELFISEAIESILSQTYHDYEFIIVDDGSSDNSAAIAEKYAENNSRIRLFRKPHTGISATLNFAASQAKGKFLARQDSDDISFPCRLEQQARFLEKNADVLLLGTAASILAETNSGRTYYALTEHEQICDAFLFTNPFCHGSVVFRRDVFFEVGGYSEMPHSYYLEDYLLWIRIAECGRVANLPKVLYQYHCNPDGFSGKGPAFLQKRELIKRELISPPGRYYRYSLVDGYNRKYLTNLRTETLSYTDPAFDHESLIRSHTINVLIWLFRYRLYMLGLNRLFFFLKQRPLLIIQSAIPMLLRYGKQSIAHCCKTSFPMMTNSSNFTRGKSRKRP